MLPTKLASINQQLFHTLELYESANQKNINGSQLLGKHLKGTYFSINQRGVSFG
jgi:N-acetylglucosamine-6-phosphate deacetylase